MKAQVALSFCCIVVLTAGSSLPRGRSHLARTLPRTARDGDAGNAHNHQHNATPVPGDYQLPEDAAGESGLPAYGAPATEAQDSYGVPAGVTATEKEDEAEDTAETESNNSQAPSSEYEANALPQPAEKPQQPGKPAAGGAGPAKPANGAGAKKPTKPAEGPAVSQLPSTGLTLPGEANKKPAVAAVTTTAAAPSKTDSRKPAGANGKPAGKPTSSATPDNSSPATAPAPASGKPTASAVSQLPTSPSTTGASPDTSEEAPEEVTDSSTTASDEESTETTTAVDETSAAARECPNGTLAACVQVCPGTSGRVYGACVQGCGDRCPE